MEIEENSQSSKDEIESSDDSETEESSEVINHDIEVNLLKEYF